MSTSKWNPEEGGWTSEEEAAFQHARAVKADTVAAERLVRIERLQEQIVDLKKLLNAIASHAQVLTDRYDKWRIEECRTADVSTPMEDLKTAIACAREAAKEYE